MISLPDAAAILAGIVFTSLGGFLLLVGGAGFAAQRRALGRTLLLPGVVVGAQEERMRGSAGVGRGSYSMPVVSFHTPEGREQRFTAHVGTPTAMPAGTPVQVRWDPRGEVEPSLTGGRSRMTLLGGVALMGLIGAGAGAGILLTQLVG